MSDSDRRRAAYESVRGEALTLRDRLAADRTVLANERTFLAYVRTAFAFAVGGATLLHFFGSGWALPVGWAMIALGAAFLAWGVQRFLTERRRLAPLRGIETETDRGGSA
jgi:putative membrane protein